MLALETAWLMKWDGHGGDYEMPVLWRHADKSAFPLRRHLATFIGDCSPTLAPLASSKFPHPVVFMVELQQQSRQDSFS